MEGNKWYEHVPKPGKTSQDNQATKLQNQQITRNRIIPRNKPDITLQDRKGTCLLIYVCLYNERHQCNEEGSGLIIETRRPSDRNTAYVKREGVDDREPVIHDNFKRKSTNVELQKRVISESAHVLRKHLIFVSQCNETSRIRFDSDLRARYPVIR